MQSGLQTPSFSLQNRFLPQASNEPHERMNENKILWLLTIKVSGCRLTADGRPMGEKTEGKLGNIHPVVNITVITDA